MTKEEALKYYISGLENEHPSIGDNPKAKKLLVDLLSDAFEIGWDLGSVSHKDAGSGEIIMITKRWVDKLKSINQNSIHKNEKQNKG